MRSFIIALAFLFIGVISFNGSASSVNTNAECEYWSTVVYENGQYWLYEYCDDKIVTITPLLDED